jgi:myo-inositol-hexaphosphate 3-phosphohydrolase
MTTNVLSFERKDEGYWITGNGSVFVSRNSGDVLLVKGMKGAIESKAVKGFSLDQKTNELYLDLSKGQRIPLGSIADYDQASSWIDEVNRLYSR